MAQAAAKPTLMHASCVALSPAAGLLIMGPSGSGKSTLALELMARGAHLVSDDQTQVSCAPGGEALTASAPDTISGMIEARGIGLLAAETLAQAMLKGVVDLSRVETERLPPFRTITLQGIRLPVMYKVDSPAFAPALLQWLKGGRRA